MSKSPKGRSSAPGRSRLLGSASSPAEVDQEHLLREQQLEKMEKQVVASTFANMELANAKRSLAQYMDLFELSKREVESLRAELKERDVDSLQVLEYLRLELAQKTAKLDDLERAAKSAAEHHESHVRATTTRLTTLLNEKDNQLTAAHRTIAQLQKQLEELSVFSRERQEMALELDRSKEAYQAMVTQYERELTKLRFQTMEEKVKLKAAETEMVKKFNSEVDARATILVDVKAKSIHENNKNLVHDKGLLEKEVGDLVTLTTEVQAELKEAQRNAELDLRIQQEALVHAAKLNKVARESDAKAQMLETRCHSLKAEHDAALERERALRRDETRRLEARVKELEAALLRHRHELVRVRQLAGTVVSQRSELENFFYEALADVQRLRSGGQPSLGGHLAAGPSSQEEVPNTALVPVLPSSASLRSAIKGGRAGARGGDLLTPTSSLDHPGGTWYQLTGRAASGGSFGYGGGMSVSPRRQQYDRGAGQSKPFLGGGALAPSSSSLRMAPSPRDLQLRSTPRVLSTPGRNDRRTGAGQGPATANDPEEDLASVPIPSLRDDGGGGAMFPDLNDGVDFQQLSWSDKELIIRSLLYYINQTFYRPVHPASAGGLVDDLAGDKDIHHHHHHQQLPSLSSCLPSRISAVDGGGSVPSDPSPDQQHRQPQHRFLVPTAESRGGSAGVLSIAPALPPRPPNSSRQRGPGVA